MNSAMDKGYEWCLSSVLRFDFLRFVFSEKVLAISNSFFLVATWNGKQPYVSAPLESTTWIMDVCKLCGSTEVTLHFPMCLSLSRNMASSDTAVQASMEPEVKCSPTGRQQKHTLTPRTNYIQNNIRLKWQILVANTTM